jgi:branched-chain amino acid transport system ATP-binding protein
VDTILLRALNLTKQFHGLVAVSDFNFDVRKGEILGLVGPNGAGKTTIFNLITGFLKPSKGKIVFDGHDITGRNPSSIAAQGVGRTFQSNVLFNNQSCLANVVVAHHLQRKSGILSMIVRTVSSRAEEERIRAHSEEILGRSGLAEMKDELAGSLSQGFKRALGIAVALATDPKILLLDEPVAGMSHDETENVKSLIERLNNEGMTVLLVEHNVDFVMGICGRIIVVNFGSKLAEGQPSEICNNEDVISAYLGAKREE